MGGGRGKDNIPSTVSATEHKRTRTKGGNEKLGLGRRDSARVAPTTSRPSSTNPDNAKDKKGAKDNKEAAAAAAPPTAASEAKAAPAEPELRSLRATTSPPIDAMEAAVTAATKKHVETHGGDALSSLQRMISDLKAISPTNSNPGSRQVSGSKHDKASSVSPTTSTPPMSATLPTAPVSIPAAGGAASSTKLKADAPSFTPGSLRSGNSPLASTATLSTSVGAAPPPSRSPTGSAHGRRTSAAQSVSSPFNFASPPPGGFIPSPAGFPQLPHFPLAASGFPGAEGADDLGGFPNDAFQQQQQLLAAQQLQLQLLQAQIVQQQIAAQQQREQGFVAPRFQALAAQRVALQQQQAQAAQLAEAQRLFELHQQQQLLLAQQQEEATRSAAPLASPPAVFEEDSPETTPSLGPTGRPQLNPGFTFGRRRESGTDPNRPPVVVNRSEGIGGAAATGLAGLAARAHKRSGSELTPAMEEQVRVLHSECAADNPA